MKRWLAAGLFAALSAGASAAENAAPVKKAPPSIEAVFVLDTTGSMGSLLEGAKRKVWAIVNEMAKGRPTPKIKLGLVAYRDRRDQYVTQVTPLSANLDAVYEKLLGFQANGGGDGPEDVLGALRDAVEKAGWSKEGKALRLIYLVGDAPPHEDYKDVPPYSQTLQKAVTLGIRVNAIRCGSDDRTGEKWQEIARLGEGRFFSIDQSGGVKSVDTPFDTNIAQLQAKLERTTLGYGVRAEEAKKEMKRSEGFLSALAAGSAAPAAMADRAAFKSKAGFSREMDLVSAVDEGSAKLEEVKDEELPPALKGKSLEAKRAELDKVRAERARLKAQLSALSKKREAFLSKEAEKGPKDGFDAKVVEALREQAGGAGIKY